MYNGDKITKNMQIKQITKKFPRHGFINDISRACGVSRHTVRTAVFENAKGVKAEFVRRYYRANYKQMV